MNCCSRTTRQIRVGVSMRSGTLQYLHISEYGQVCARFPEKAREIRTGALNTIQAGQVVFIESTGEGQEGHYFDLCEAAKTKQRTGEPLSTLDFKFHFYPWFKESDYQIDPAGVVIPDDLRRYFEKLETTQGIKLTPAQQAWYCQESRDAAWRHEAGVSFHTGGSIRGFADGRLLRRPDGCGGAAGQDRNRRAVQGSARVAG